ncbi:IS3 family transposase, partial [Klebsiella oxytoca]|nr:IS3 family transposase [Klebsiella oxytoca]ELK5576205.1 IS3 family transposase [Klebsiella oxytoca]HEG4375014.1 IS3 family transposase [Klebsiella oxytoca]
MKKGYSFADVGRQQALKLVSALSPEYSIKELCAVLGVCRSLVYYHRKRRKQPDTTRITLQRRAAELHRLGRGSAGARTLSLLFRREGENVGRYKARRLMKEAGLVSRQPGKHRYRQCNRQSHLTDNHLSRNFRTGAPDNVWCGDITFIRTREGWLYLAVVLDLYARKVVGWAFSSVPDSQLTKKALTMAWKNRGRPKGVTFHSDQGSQYASVSYREMAKLYGLKLSMSRKGNCWDNAVAERLFRSLKTEWLLREGYRNRSEAAKDVVQYLSGYYNRVRPHKHNGGLTPTEMERQRTSGCV